LRGQTPRHVERVRYGNKKEETQEHEHPEGDWFGRDMFLTIGDFLVEYRGGHIWSGIKSIWICDGAVVFNLRDQNKAIETP